MLGGYSALDGTVEFYGHIDALLKPEFIVVDLGAGRGAWYGDAAPYPRSLRLIKGRVAKVLGLDVASAVLSNSSTDENLLIDGERLPLPDESIDLMMQITCSST